MTGTNATALSEEAEASRGLGAAHRRVLSSLSESRIPFLVLRVPTVAPEPPRELDLLIPSGFLDPAAEVLRNIHFLPKTVPLGIPSKVVFATNDGDRFRSLDVHTSVVSRGLIYLDANTLLRRRCTRHGIPLPSLEDSLLHLVLHALLGRKELGGKYSERIRQLASMKLDEAYLGIHLSRFGLEPVFRQALAGILGGSSANPRDLRHRAARILIWRHPGNLLRSMRYRFAHGVRIRRRSALVAFVGVDGVGKSALVAALEKRLAKDGLRTSSVYMGCWGRFQTRAMWVRSYSPRDAPPAGETRLQAIDRVLKNLGKFPLFYGGILVEQGVRYRRGVVNTAAHLVLSDRYIYDLELPFSRRYVRTGRRFRRLIYRWFPAPDMVIHLQGEPGEIRRRKAELEEEQMERFEATYREVLGGRPVTRLRVEGTPDELAGKVLGRFWEEFLQACWRHSPRGPLRKRAFVSVDNSRH